MRDSIEIAREYVDLSKVMLNVEKLEKQKLIKLAERKNLAHSPNVFTP